MSSFKYVYIAGMEDGVFPGTMSIISDDRSEIEEERRLAYVGITRAKEQLTLTAARSRMIRGETQFYPISRFVREIPESLLRNAIPDRVRGIEDAPVIKNTPRRPIAVKGTPSVDNPYILVATQKAASATKEATNVTNGTLPYGVGDRVVHFKYGEGEVTAIKPGPKDYQVTVIFDEAGQKIMYAGFAKLRKI